MSNLNDYIKNLAYKVSEGYLLFGRPVNEELSKRYASGDIENKEILKRVCELVNQDIYLSLFHDSKTDKSNINFKLANYNEIIDNNKMMEESMLDYNSAPEDFKSNLSDFILNIDAPDKKVDIHEKVASLNSIGHFESLLDTIETSFVKQAEEAYLEIKRDVRDLTVNGDTIDDMSKVAELFLEDEGFETTKVASALNLAGKELEEWGYNVKRGFTKIANQTIDANNEFFNPIFKFAEAVESIDAVKEIKANLANVKSMVKESI